MDHFFFGNQMRHLKTGNLTKQKDTFRIFRQINAQFAFKIETNTETLQRSKSGKIQKEVQTSMLSYSLSLTNSNVYKTKRKMTLLSMSVSFRTELAH